MVNNEVLTGEDTDFPDLGIDVIEPGNTDQHHTYPCYFYVGTENVASHIYK